jgi:hypothetical protein
VNGRPYDQLRWPLREVGAPLDAAVVPQPDTLSATIGFVLMAAYAAAARCLGATALSRRDA